MSKSNELERLIAVDRDAPEACEAGTPGCCIDHSAEQRRYREQLDCECW